MKLRDKIALAAFAGSLLFITFIVAKDHYFLFSNPVKWPVAHKAYTVTQIEDAKPPTPPVLPDLSGYTLENIQKKKPQPQRGRVRIATIESTPGMEKFAEKRRTVEFSRLQKTTSPKTIVIQSGVYTLDSLYEQLAAPDALEKAGDEYILKIPLYVDKGATLIVEGTSGAPKILKMSSISGGFLVNSGFLFIIHADLSGWDDQSGTYSAYDPAVSDKIFKPFFVSWSGSESYFYGSLFRHMGYHMSKSYGVSFSSSNTMLKENPDIAPPSGWIVNNTFDDLYYGFYCYEAKHVAIIGNTYKDNVIYGIDPHDRSSHLIIARNEAYGTIKKHGIIVSREVNDSWIFENSSHGNKGSGFMLDRSSVRNVVAYNKAYLNGNDGLTLFESQDNVIYGNLFAFNGRTGYRVRNSWNVSGAYNKVLFNGADGIHIYAVDIRKTEKNRDFVFDPFTQRAAFSSYGDTLLGNRAGAIKMNDVEVAEIADMGFFLYHRRFLRGDIDTLGQEIAQGLARSPHALRIALDTAVAAALANQQQTGVIGALSSSGTQNDGDVLGDLDEDGGGEE